MGGEDGGSGTSCFPSRLLWLGRAQPSEGLAEGLALSVFAAWSPSGQG